MTKKTKKIIISLFITLLLFVLFVIILLFVKKVDKKLNTYEVIDTPMYQYFGEQRFDYTTNLTISNENEIKKLEVDGKEVVLSSEPFYFTNERKILFPEEMSLIIPSSNLLQVRLPFFTILDGTVLETYLKNVNLNYYIDDAFIFDGNNLYLFPFGTTLTVNNEEYSLSSFSFVTVDYLNNECIFYDYETDIATKIEVKEDVFAKTNNSTLNLSIDAILTNGKQRLLIKDLKYLDLLTN